MRQLLISTLLVGALAGGAVAQDIVRVNPFLGSWRCTGFGNQPAGIMKIEAASYEYTVVDQNWTPVDSPDNGGGIMTFGNHTALPFGGPLLIPYGVTGHFQPGTDSIHWEGDGPGNLFCHLQVN